MKLNLIRNLLPGFIGLLVLLTLPAPTSANPQASCGELDADGIKAELNFPAGPVKSGSNEVIVNLYDAAGIPVGGAEVTVVIVQSSQANPAGPNKTGDSHSHQAETHAQADTGCSIGTAANNQQPAQPDEHDMADMTLQAETGLGDHQPVQASEHDMADMAPQAGTEVDSHQPVQPTEHDMADAAGHTETETDNHQSAAGHSGGHDEPALAELAASSTPGEYQGQVSFNAEGRWLVNVNFSAQGQSEEVEFTVDVVKREPNWYVLGGFLSVNMLVMATAAVMKQRTIKAESR